MNFSKAISAVYRKSNMHYDKGLIGVEGVLWAGPASDILAFILSVILVLSETKHLTGRFGAGKLAGAAVGGKAG